MPVPKQYMKLYGIIVATQQKRGASLEKAKAMADQAIRDRMRYKTKKKS